MDSPGLLEPHLTIDSWEGAYDTTPTKDTMKISVIFPSKYVAAADLNGKTVTLTIKSVTMEEMVTHENKKVVKPVVWFEKATKGFVMNQTNAKIIVALYGDETDGWAGKRIAIYPTRVKAFGQMQDCIRVREEIPAQPKPTAQAPQTEERAEFDDAEDYSDVDPMWEPDGEPA